MNQEKKRQIHSVGMIKIQYRLANRMLDKIYEQHANYFHSIKSVAMQFDRIQLAIDRSQIRQRYNQKLPFSK